MNTSAIKPTPKPSVITTPSASASQPAPLISESPIPDQTPATTTATAINTAAAIPAAIRFCAGFTDLSESWRGLFQYRRSLAQILDEAVDLVTAGLLVRSAQQRRRMHCGEGMGRQREGNEPAAIPRHAKGFAEQRLRGGRS